MKKKRKNSSDYTQNVIMLAMRHFIVLIDLDLGNRSLTNDIDKAVDEVLQEIDPMRSKEYNVIYKDSMGEWNAYFRNTNEIRYLGGPDDPKKMAQKYLEKFELILN